MAVVCFGLGGKATTDPQLPRMGITVRMNAHYDQDCPPPTGDPRPAYGQMLPRWNKGGRQP